MKRVTTVKIISSVSGFQADQGFFVRKTGMVK
jgi:hypothetical protein